MKTGNYESPYAKCIGYNVRTSVLSISFEGSTEDMGSLSGSTEGMGESGSTDMYERGGAW